MSETGSEKRDEREEGERQSKGRGRETVIRDGEEREE